MCGVKTRDLEWAAPMFSLVSFFYIKDALSKM